MDESELGWLEHVCQSTPDNGNWTVKELVGFEVRIIRPGSQKVGTGLIAFTVFNLR